MPDVLTVKEAAARFRCTTECILSAIHSGRLVAVNVGRENARRPSWRIPAWAIDQWERGEVPTKPAKPSRRRTRAADRDPGWVSYF